MRCFPCAHSSRCACRNSDDPFERNRLAQGSMRRLRRFPLLATSGESGFAGQANRRIGASFPVGDTDTDTANGPPAMGNSNPSHSTSKIQRTVTVAPAICSPTSPIADPKVNDRDARHRGLECHLDKGCRRGSLKLSRLTFSIQASRARNVADPLWGPDYWRQRILRHLPPHRHGFCSQAMAKRIFSVIFLAFSVTGPCSDAHCGGCPRFAGRRSFCDGLNNWVRFVILKANCLLASPTTSAAVCSTACVLAALFAARVKLPMM